MTGDAIEAKAVGMTAGKEVGKPIKGGETSVKMVQKMARPYDIIIELDEKASRKFMESILHPKRDPVREKFIREAMAMKFDVR